MKKVHIIIMIIALVTAGCSVDQQAQSTASTSESITKSIESKSIESSTTTQTTQAQVETTTVAETNRHILTLKYDDVINKEMYTGFTEGQLDMLNQNGFVVLEPNYEGYVYPFLYQRYEGAEYSDQSVFITTDAVLHMFHIFYGNSMKALESLYYFNELNDIALTLTENIAVHYQAAPSDLKAHYKRLYAYALVGCKLLNTDKVDFTSDTATAQRYGELARRWDAITQNVPKDIDQLADQEFSQINADNANAATRGDFPESGIFQKELDYSQFTVRGHYTQSTALANYFKAMMWFSNPGFDIEISKRDNVVVATLLSLELNNSPKLLDKWSTLYDMTSFYSGKSDDLNHRDFTKLVESVYGSTLKLDQPSGLSALVDATKDKALEQAIRELPKPRITPVIRENSKFKGMDYNRQFRLMGQRFTFDSFVMTNLTKSPERLNTNPFDVLAVMGNPEAEELLYEYFNPAEKWPEYPEVLKSYKDMYQKDRDKLFSDDLYHGWMKGIDLVMNETISGKVPHFIASDAYKYKRINTALGSFAELKHDNVLYSKQMMAEMGGADDEGGLPLHYVEPNVALYEHLKALTNQGKEGISKQKIQDETIVEPLDAMVGYLDLFAKVSQKELSNETISQDELFEIAQFGGFVDYLRMHYFYEMMEAYGEGIDLDKSSAIISDIATIISLGYQELGVGLPYEIYALVEVNGKTVLTSGVVYSSYIFYSDKRLTDESWQAMNGLVNVEEGYDYLSFDIEQLKMRLTEQMPYTKAFVSTEPNRVEEHMIEMKWPKE